MAFPDFLSPDLSQGLFYPGTGGAGSPCSRDGESVRSKGAVARSCLLHGEQNLAPLGGLEHFKVVKPAGITSLPPQHKGLLIPSRAPALSRDITRGGRRVVLSTAAQLARLFGQAMSAPSQLAPPLQAVVCLLSQPPDEVLPCPQAGMPFLADA